MNLAEELRNLKRQVEENQLQKKSTDSEFTANEIARAQQIIGGIPQKLKAAVLAGKKLELIMPIKGGCGEGDVEFNYSVKPRGMAIIPEDLISTAKIVWQWCQNQKLKVGLGIYGYPDGPFGIIVTL